MKSLLYNIAYTVGWVCKIRGVSILVYHAISDDTKDPYAVSFNDFKEQIKSLVNTVSFYSLDDVVSAINQGKTLDGVSITFDDGYRSVLSAIPVLKTYNIPATVFVLADPLHANRRELQQEEELLSDKDLRILVQEGITIGCHSMTHPDFSSLTRHQIRREIFDAKTLLEKKIKREVCYFSYPKSRHTEDVVKAVMSAGYRAAFSVRHSCAVSKSSVYRIPRIIIDKTYTSSHFLFRISPGMQVVRSLYEKL
ncbi:MAG: polysaccharide deacetylase family protein [Patescibacteria group bacterium]|nr:polysaccharide deacetylase family protein [Patescibacteria group bacterium]